MNIKFHRIDRLYDMHSAMFHIEMERTYRDGRVLQSHHIKDLEEQVASLCNRRHAVLVGSCTDALSFALIALGIDFGDLVIAPSFTFPATHTCIERLQGEKFLVRQEDRYFQMDLDYLENECFNELRHAKAIIVANLFGQMSNMDRLNAIAEKYHIPIIEDAAQSFTSMWDARPAGSFGEVSCISFDPTKIIPAFSTGGMLLTDNPHIADNVRFYRYKNFGCNSQMSTFQVKILLYWLGFIDLWENKRRNIATEYTCRLAPFVETPETLPLSKHVWHKYVIKAKDRDKLQKHLLDNGVETKLHYAPHPSVLSLPIYPHLRTDEVEYVCEKIIEFYS